MNDFTPDELQDKLKNSENVFLKLWKPGCGACKLSEPAIERLEKQDAHRLLFVQINVEDFPEMLEIAETEVIPAFFVFSGGKMQGKRIGFKGLKVLQELIHEALDVDHKS